VLDFIGFLPFPLRTLNAVSAGFVEMILQVSLGGFHCMLLRPQVVRVRQVGVMAGLLAVTGQAKFGCLSVVASRLFIVLRR